MIDTPLGLTWMQAFYRDKAEKAHYLWCIRNALGCDHMTARDLYQTGKVPALFPLPAIREEIEFLPDRVILWNKSGREYTFRYLAITYEAWLDFGWCEKT